MRGGGKRGSNPLSGRRSSVYPRSKRTVYNEYARRRSWKKQRVDIVDLFILRTASEVSGREPAVNYHMSFRFSSSELRSRFFGPRRHRGDSRKLSKRATRF